MMLTYLGVGLLGGFVINYLSDTFPATRRLAKPDWWPISASSLRMYFSRSRVLVVLAISVFVAYLLYQYPPEEFSVYFLAIILFYFFVVTVIDIEHRVVMHPVSIAGAILMTAIGVLRGHSIVDTLIGGAVGFGFMLLLFYLGDWLGKMLARARKEAWEETALGFGDVNLAGVIGLLMGWPGVVAALFIGMFAAGLFSAGYLLLSFLGGKYRAFASIPYAPFLSLGAIASVLLGIYLA